MKRIAFAQKFEPWADLTAFGVTMVIAVAEGWNPSDIVWSLWTTSLMLGYVYIILWHIGPLLHKTQRRGRGGPLSLFTLVFIFFHFSFFHLVHSFFLSQFFPNPLLNIAPFASGEVDGVASQFFTTLRWALFLYWPFVLTSAFSRFDIYTEALNDKNADMMTPYKNVARMHIMIIVFGFMMVAGLTSHALYLVLIFHFFPLNTLKQIRSRLSEATS